MQCGNCTVSYITVTSIRIKDLAGARWFDALCEIGNVEYFI